MRAWAKRDARWRLRRACATRSICAGDVVPLLRDIVESHGTAGALAGALPEQLTADLDDLLQLPLREGGGDGGAEMEGGGEGLANVLELMAVAMADEREQQEMAEAHAIMKNFLDVFGGGGGPLFLDGARAAANLRPARELNAAWWHRARAYEPQRRLPAPAAPEPAPAPAPALSQVQPPPAEPRAPRPRASTAVESKLRAEGWELRRASKHYVFKRGAQTFVQSRSPRTDNPRCALGTLERLNKEALAAGVGEGGGRGEVRDAQRHWTPV